jgi:hypothetical protein
MASAQIADVTGVTIPRPPCRGGPAIQSAKDAPSAVNQLRRRE